MIKSMIIPGSIKRRIEDDIGGMHPGKNEVQFSVNILPSNYLSSDYVKGKDGSLVPVDFMHFISPKLPKKGVEWGDSDIYRDLMYWSKNNLQLLWYMVKGRWMANVLEDNLKEMEKSGKGAGIIRNINFSLEPDGEGRAFIRDCLNDFIGRIDIPYPTASLVGYKNRRLDAYKDAGSRREPIEIGYE
jgi:hypothetical protein